MTTLERLMTKVEKKENGCWLWTGALGGSGLYGQISIKGKVYRAHRVMFEQFNDGDIDDLCVLHRCDTPACVNPDHLFSGTRKDNMEDLLKKGRLGRNAKLSHADILSIRSLSSGGMKTELISEQYKINASHVNKILRRDIWSHI